MTTSKIPVAASPASPGRSLSIPEGHPVVVFGGTFDPPHEGHVSAAVGARDELFGDDGWLVVVPAARSPHKAVAPVASDVQRIRMLGLAFGSVPRVFVWTDELDRSHGSGEPSFTIDTVRRLREVVRPPTPVRLLIGADQAIAYDRWKDSAELERLAEPAVALRPPHSGVDALLGAGLDAGRWGPRVLKTPLVDAASSDVRSGQHTDLPPGVRALIEAEGLYR